jgi:hypothetical protein
VPALCAQSLAARYFASMKHLLFAFALLGAPLASLAQAAPPVSTTYEFLTVAEIESPSSGLAKILFAPAFQGRSELPLENLPMALSIKYPIIYQRNLQMVNRQLEAVTADGWELMHVSSNTATTGHEYLFRRPKS